MIKVIKTFDLALHFISLHFHKQNMDNLDKVVLNVSAAMLSSEDSSGKEGFFFFFFLIG